MKQTLPFSIIAIMLAFVGSAMFISDRYGNGFWLTQPGAVTAVAMAIAGVAASALAFRYEMSKGRFVPMADPEAQKETIAQAKRFMIRLVLFMVFLWTLSFMLKHMS